MTVKRPQMVTLELEDLADLCKGPSKTEDYINRLEQSNDSSYALLDQRMNQVKQMHKENVKLKSKLLLFKDVLDICIKREPDLSPQEWQTIKRVYELVN
ncbi:hypothetical protein [Endozoicomonas sp. GU-1]|uniref:hypothetical protein n=1 Tax=Endozoicomonas sp. GU-1 TaxID=3009078 RepID=UPI0022B54692|nr:hypothetical protein [Endozoicomonas sp. GU-1]WBA86509.1 hypothetical protein O3276_00160 [Endozoicomonas sp. GU-1]